MPFLGSSQMHFRTGDAYYWRCLRVRRCVYLGCCVNTYRVRGYVKKRKSKTVVPTPLKNGVQDHSQAIRRARASKLKNRRARASKLKTTHMLRNLKRISEGRTLLRPKPGSDAWGIVQGLVSARRRASLGPTPPLQKPAFRPNLPLPFLLTLSGHNSPPDVAREEHPWRLPRIAVMPRRHGDTRFDGMIRSVDTGQLAKRWDWTYFERT